MMEKCARVVVMRNTYSISGVYDEAEMARMQVAPPAQVEEEIEWGEDPFVANRLRSLVEAINEIDDTMWRPAKLQAKLAGLTDEEREGIAREMEEFIIARGGTIPEPPVDAEAEEIDAEAPQPA